MNKAKVTEYDYIDFLIGTQRVYSCPEAERVHPDEEEGPAHDAYTRQLHRLFPTTERLWSEAKEQVDLHKGSLIVDDSPLDKFYSRKIAWVTRHWSGKHKRVVQGINLVTRLAHNRQVNLDRTGNRSLNQVEIAETGALVHLKGYGLINVFKIVKTDDDLEYWATNDLQMTDLMRLK